MKRLLFFTTFIITGLFCTAACAFTASYTQKVTGSGIVNPQRTVVKIKDDKVRIEMDTAEGKTISIIDGDTMMSYMPSQNMAFKMKTEVQRGMEVLSDYTSYLESLDARVAGSERVGPYDCDIYEFVDPRLDMQSRVWLWKAKQFPVKVETETPSGPMTTIMEDVKIGIAIDDSEFRLPAGVQVISAPAMGQ